MAPKFSSKGGAKGGAKGSGKAARATGKPAMTKQSFESKPGKSQPKGQAKGKDKGKGKGKSQGKHQGGKGQGKAETENPGFQGKRQRVNGGRVTGTVISWKGPFGWIKPDAHIDHPAASRRGGKIYLDQVDVEEELSGVGARVSFFLYFDDAGLGAQKVTNSKGAPVKKTIEKPKGKGKGKGKNEGAEKKLGKGAAAGEGKAKAKGKGKGKKGGSKADGEAKVHQPPDKTLRESLTEGGNGTIVDWFENVGWLKPDEPLEHPDVKQHGRRKGLLFVHSSDCEGDLPLMGAQVTYSVYKDDHGLGAEGVIVIEQGDGVRPPKPEAAAGEEGAPKKKEKHELKKVLQKSSLLKSKAKGKGKGKGKGKASKTAGEKLPSGPDLARERVSDDIITGEVVSWSGRIGWIRPSEKIDHPEAAKHGGKLWAHIKDLVADEDTKMQRGQTVQCVVFKDASGLGAEEITPL